MHLIQFNSHVCMFFLVTWLVTRLSQKPQKPADMSKTDLWIKRTIVETVLFEMKFCTLRELVSCFWMFLVWSVDRECFCWHVDRVKNVKTLIFKNWTIILWCFTFSLFHSTVPCLSESGWPSLYVTCHSWWPLKFEKNLRWQEWWVGCQRSSGPWFSFFWLCYSALTETKINWEFDLSPRTQDAGGDSGSHK